MMMESDEELPKQPSSHVVTVSSRLLGGAWLHPSCDCSDAAHLKRSYKLLTVPNTSVTRLLNFRFRRTSGGGGGGGGGVDCC